MAAQRQGKSVFHLPDSSLDAHTGVCEDRGSQLARACGVPDSKMERWNGSWEDLAQISAKGWRAAR